MRETDGQGRPEIDTDEGSARDPEAAAFVRRFASAWAAPTPERLGALIYPEGVLVQPLMPCSVGRSAAEAGFERLLRRIPDLYGRVERWAGGPEGLFVEFELAGTVGRREISWPVVDRFRLREGLVAERVSYFDPLPLLRESLRSPTAIPRLLALARRS